MYFKSLDLIGFKSFPDRTRFNFEPGVTAIVGPNGCGKSNIADAIRWVLGEQNARLLRGARMEDVIFCGSDGRKPLGLAEVSLTLAGADASLGVDWSEVTVTRRAFRSGEGQYLINRNPCRLRDIEEIFMGTGIGLSAYSIIEQGKMDMVISSRPEDRRFIFEEAAGITKYKERKREALRKLDSTEANLARLGDIIGEVRRQLASVERQAARARRAKEVGDRLRDLEIRYASRRLADLDAEIARGEAARGEAAGREAEMKAEIARLEAEAESLREALHDLDRDVDSLQARREGVAGGIENNRSRIEADERLIRELEESERLFDGEIRALEEALAALVEERAGLEAGADEAARAAERAASECAAAERGLEESAAALSECEERLGARQAELIDVVNLASRERNELDALRAAARGAALRAARLEVERRELAERREEASRALEGKRAGREEIERGRQAAAAAVADAGRRGDEARRALEALRDERARRDAEIARCDSMCAALRRCIENREGLGDGVRRVMAAAGGGGLAGILGVAADRITASPGYERALEAALGHALQFILAGSLDDALLAARLLEGGEEAFFLPAEGLAEPPDVGGLRGPGLAGRAIDLVSFEPSFGPAARRLLAGAYFVEGLDEARALLGSCRPGVRLATRAGELLVAGGEARTVAGGRAACMAVSARNELDRELSRADALRGGMAGLLAEIAGAGEAVREADAAAAGAGERLRGADIALARANAEEAASAAALERIDSETEAVLAEAAEIDAGGRESSAREAAIEASVAARRERERELQEAVRAAREEAAARSREREERRAAVTDLKVLAAAAREKAGGLRSGLERLRAQVAQSESALRGQREQRERAAARRAALAREVAALKIAVETLLRERETSDSDARRREEGKASLYERQKRAGDLLREAVAGLEARKDEIRKIEVALAGARARRQALVDSIVGQYGTDPASVAVDEAVTDWEAVGAEVVELREKLRRMGPVNMGALEEQEELAGRLAFLTEQERDLLSAKDSLLKAIGKINVETRRMFTETFGAIRSNFTDLFKDLFGGGSADLLLEEGADVLEAGINIMARPPGKRLQGISLLSGGEKALTAVALLFAIFKVRPSPFCVLDEIDAPLDESNINRFLEMLGSFLERTQFIIITHNKRTISLADVMYGITMEEKGVSKVVSVKFRKEKEAEPR
ncbi:MAG: chromosome segregation protein SMC [bacterium]|nr:chromosome segregation protein SMC [bacterium]